MDTRIEASMQATRIAEMHGRAERSRLAGSGADASAAAPGRLAALRGYFRRGANGIGRLHRA